MLDFIQYTSPFISAVVLGIVFVLDPCALLSNIAAIGYISKDYANRRQIFRNYFFFVLGRIFTLGILGLLLVFLFKSSITWLNLTNFLNSYSEIIFIPFLIIIGLILLFADKISFLKITFSTQKLEKQNSNSLLQAFLFGSALSLVLCPTNIVLFFGMLIPLSINALAGNLLPFVFSISSSLPIIIIMLIMIFGINNIDKFYRIADKAGKYIIKISGVIFLLAGIYVFVEHLFFHAH
ncbi:MAG: sulfite exporter TauE/SafE family protein [Prevotellaceae bacterium]|jgi:cytochrome c biogenesis protein CcdA|nr:sulfite exporter TauE/SafE family protein [Prevotellaceae bacterium]